MRLRWRLEVLRDQKGQCRVVVRLSDNCRVIECRDDIQWIIQVRYGNRWRNVSYHLNRDVLIGGLPKCWSDEAG